MTFGRQNNLSRRAVRPDGRTLRDTRRRGVGKASLLDVLSGEPAPASGFSRFIAAIVRFVRRR